jgi:hypothetical protein
VDYLKLERGKSQNPPANTTEFLYVFEQPRQSLVVGVKDEILMFQINTKPFASPHNRQTLLLVYGVLTFGGGQQTTRETNLG